MRALPGWADPLSIVGVGCLIVYGSWVGFIGSDDASYASAGRNWIEAFPYLGTDHWSLRHPLTLPIAVSFAIFGVSELSLALPSIISTLALPIGAYYVLHGQIGRSNALLVALAVPTIPIVASSASVANVDVVESVFALGSIVAFAAAIRSRGRLPLLFLAGVLAGVAFSARETAVALVLFYGILFLISYGVPRWSYLVVGAGFLAIYSLESAAYLVTTGDPFYRLNISLHHDNVNRVVAATGLLDRAGNLSTITVLNPVALLLANNEFALVFWAFIPAAYWALRRGPNDPQLAALLRLLTGLALTWCAFVAVAGAVLYLLPRYVYTAAVCALIVVLIWILGELRSAAVRASAIAAIVGSNLLMVSLENHSFMFAERTFARVVAQRDEPVHTDPETLRRAGFFLELQGTTDRASYRAPRRGELFLYAPNNVERNSTGPLGALSTDYRPHPDFEPVQTFEPGKKWPGLVFDMIGLDPREIVPVMIYRKVIEPNVPVTLYRVRGAD